ncbi:MAG: glycosyltransferase family 39 protein [Phycisphaerae bacterium]|nr:glycosyltransferase family 39 protein [Phycisphaerae bacterium]
MNTVVSQDRSPQFGTDTAGDGNAERTESAESYFNSVVIEPQIRRRRIRFLALSASFLIAVLLDLFLFTGYYASDDKEYFFGAARVVDSGSLAKWPLIGHTRLTVLAWNAVVGWLTNFDVSMMAASYVLVHAFLVYLIFRLASRVAGESAGLLAAYTSAVFPLFSVFSTGLYPDLFIACGFLLAMLAFLRVYELRDQGRRLAAAGLMFVAGVAVGVAYMAKESGLVALPFYFAAWFITEWKDWSRSRKDHSARGRRDPMAGGVVERTNGRAGCPLFIRLATGLCFALGFFAIFGFEYKSLQALSGNSEFFRLGWTEKEEDLDSIGNFHLDGGYHPWRRLNASFDRLSLEYWPTLLKYCFVTGLIVYPFTPRRSWPVFFFGLWIYAFLTWGTYSFKHYYPPRIQARYYIPAFPFLIVVFSASATWLLEHFLSFFTVDNRRRWAVRVVVAAIVVSPILYLRGPNSIAGRLYRADLVANLQRATGDALAAGSRLIVVENRLANRVSPIWYAGPPAQPYARRPAAMISAGELAGAAESKMTDGPFSYISVPPAGQEVGISTASRNVMDPLAAGIANQWVVVQAARPRTGSAAGLPDGTVIFSSIEPGAVGVPRRGAYDWNIDDEHVYRKTFRSRTRQLLAWMRGVNEIPPKQSVSTGPLCLYRVTPVRTTLAVESEAGLDSTGAAVELAPGRRFRLRLAANAPMGCRVRLRLRFMAASGESGSPVRDVAIELADGVNDIYFQTSSERRFLSMSIDSSGDGFCGVRQATLTTYQVADWSGTVE